MRRERIAPRFSSSFMALQRKLPPASQQSQHIATTLQKKSLTHPVLRASPSTKGTDRICRLPLPTFFQLARGFEPWIPAAVMGTLRGANKSKISAFHGSLPALRTLKSLSAIPIVAKPYRWTNHFQGFTRVKMKRELVSGLVPR